MSFHWRGTGLKKACAKYRWMANEFPYFLLFLLSPFYLKYGTTTRSSYFWSTESVYSQRSLFRTWMANPHTYDWHSATRRRPARSRGTLHYWISYDVIIIQQGVYMQLPNKKLVCFLRRTRDRESISALGRISDSNESCNNPYPLGYSWSLSTDHYGCRGATNGDTGGQQITFGTRLL